jgi:hypothetical protein
MEPGTNEEQTRSAKCLELVGEKPGNGQIDQQGESTRSVIECNTHGITPTGTGILTANIDSKTATSSHVTIIAHYIDLFNAAVMEHQEDS